METPQLYIQVPDLVTPAELKRLRELAAVTPFEDGRKTAILAAREMKHNLQMVKDKPPGENEAEMIVTQAVLRHPAVGAAVMPRHIFAPMISRYEAGMAYGWHVDSPLMGMPPVRTDIAMTLFLNDPSTYDGGELVVQSPAGTVQYKLDPGHAVFYPADRLHRVNTVTRGTRLCAITWIQSVIRDHKQREIVLNMNYLYSMLSARDMMSQEAQLAMTLYSNLVRLWEE